MPGKRDIRAALAAGAKPPPTAKRTKGRGRGRGGGGGGGPGGGGGGGGEPPGAPFRDVSNNMPTDAPASDASGFIVKYEHAIKFLRTPGRQPKDWELRATHVKARIPGETVYVLTKGKVGDATVWMAVAKAKWHGCVMLTSRTVIDDNFDHTLTRFAEVKDWTREKCF